MSRFPFLLTMSMKEWISASAERYWSTPSWRLYPKDAPMPRQLSHFLSWIESYCWYSGVVKSWCTGESWVAPEASKFWPNRLLTRPSGMAL